MSERTGSEPTGLEGLPQIPGFSRIIAREDIPDTGLEVWLKAGEDARAHLIERFDLHSLTMFSADLVVTSWRKRGLRVEGVIRAEAEQVCVVTLVPVAATIEEKITLLFYPEDLSGRRAMEITVDPTDEEPPDALPPEGVDLGEVVAEQLALALDPYPRAPGAQLSGHVVSGDDGEKKPNPFDILKNFKSKD